MGLDKKSSKKFWGEEAKEVAHKDIKKELERAAGEKVKKSVKKVKKVVKKAKKAKKVMHHAMIR